MIIIIIIITIIIITLIVINEMHLSKWLKSYQSIRT